MTNQYLEILDRLKEEALERIRTICQDELSLREAIERIDFNYFSARLHIREMVANGFSLTDDLMRNEEDYQNNPAYRELYNHLEKHVRMMRRALQEV